MLAKQGESRQEKGMGRTGGRRQTGKRRQGGMIPCSRGLYQGDTVLSWLPGAETSVSCFPHIPVLQMPAMFVRCHRWDGFYGALTGFMGLWRETGRAGGNEVLMLITKSAGTGQQERVWRANEGVKERSTPQQCHRPSLRARQPSASLQKLKSKAFGFMRHWCG